jgi:hypothetical protein
VNAQDRRLATDRVAGLHVLSPNADLELLAASFSAWITARHQGPTLLAVCAPTSNLRLIVIVCARAEPDEAWTIMGARDASMAERRMWRKHTT